MVNFKLFPIKAIETIMCGGPNKTTLIHRKAVNPGIGQTFLTTEMMPEFGRCSLANAQQYGQYGGDDDPH
jgi:hypothetical protein